jgi:hypothetical protein
MNNEELKKAMDSAAFLTSELRKALTESSAVSGMIILDLVGQAVQIERRLNELTSNISFDETGR